MRLRRFAGIAACAIAMATSTPVSAYGSGSRTDADSACGSFALGLLTANCASLSIAATSGSCTVNNRGYFSETLDCSAGTYTVSGSVSGWLSAGSAQITMSGYQCSYPTLSRQDIAGGSPAINFGPYTIQCNPFSVSYGKCRQAAAGAQMTFTAGTGGSAPRSLYVGASINQESDGCNPDHD